VAFINQFTLQHLDTKKRLFRLLVLDVILALFDARYIIRNRFVVAVKVSHLYAVLQLQVCS
jgi:hypothetical protein